MDVSREAGSAPRWPEPPEPTGDDGVDAALAPLTEVRDHGTEEQHRIYTAIHDRLAAELDVKGTS